MGRPCFLSKTLLVFFFMFLLLSHGFGRSLKSTVQENEDSSVEVKEAGGNSRELIGVMDYEGPQPNTNPRGIIISPQPPPK